MATSSRTAPYRTTPFDTPGMPPGVPFIIGNEAAERFSFYGMRGILVVFMTTYLMGRGGQLALMTDDRATAVFHTFIASAFYISILGAILADVWWGKYRTIMALSIVYCLGHAALAVDDTRLGLLVGLGLIAVGSGGIKPCVSAHVGDQFSQTNARLLPRVYSWFYFSINLGSAIAMWSIPELLRAKGPSVAFAVPGVLMAIATLVFWTGRYRFAHVPPGGTKLLKAAFTSENLRPVRDVAVVFLFCSVFWSIYDQSSSTWVLQAKTMDLRFDWFGLSDAALAKLHLAREIKPEQMQVVNPILILLFIPLFSYVVYPVLGRFFQVTPLRKLGLGFLLGGVSFALTAWIETWIVTGRNPHVLWQIVPYIFLTAAEVLISITQLEFAYTQAPKAMKSFVTSFYLLSIALGNTFTAAVNYAISSISALHGFSEKGPSYFWFFTGLTFAAAFLFPFTARRFRGKTQLQNETDATV